MKKLIGIATFVTIGLFGYTHEAPSAQADNGTMSSLMADNEFVVGGPSNLVCSSLRPFCCEFDDNGVCLFCAIHPLACPL